MIRYLFLCVCLMLGTAAAARPVTPEEAKQAAAAWLRESRGTFGTADRVLSVRPLEGNGGMHLGYRAALADGSTLILSGDTRMTPVIACLPRSSWDRLPAGHPLPGLLQADLSGRFKAVSSRTAVLGLGPSDKERRWAALLGRHEGASTFGLTLGSHPARIFALDPGWLTGRFSHWNQESHNVFGEWPQQVYNRYTPKASPAGCVAIAGCALLQYFGVRQGPDPSLTMNCTVDGIPTRLSPLGGTYTWEVLPERWQRGQTLTDTQAELPGRVAYDVGVCSEMAYSPKSSGASQLLLARALRRHFGFSRAVYVSDPRKEDYEPLIYSQLRCGAPVGLSIEGQASNGHIRHAVVAAGYAEDAAATPYTYIFMGWGSVGDAWYTLPDIENYSVLNAVVTLLEPPGQPASLPVCGVLTDPQGRPAPGQTVTLTYTAQSQHGTYRLRTGRHGTFGLRLPYSNATVTVSHGSASRTQTLSAPDCGGEMVDAATLAPSLPRPLPNLVSDEACGLDILTDGRAARDEALRSGRLLLVLSGPTAEPTAAAMLEALAKAPQTAEMVVHLCDRDENSRDMTGETLRCAVFDPRKFEPDLGWTGNNALAEMEAPCAETLPAFLKTAAAAWVKPDLTGVTLEGPKTIYTYTPFRLQPHFSDGVLPRTVPGQSWEVTEGADIAEFSYGQLVPREGKRGTVTVRMSGYIWGKAFEATENVRIVQPGDICAVRLTAPKDLWLESMRRDIIGRDFKPHPGFVLTCTGTLADGTELQVTPESCRLTEVSPGIRADCGSRGEIWYNDVPMARHSLSAEVTFETLKATVGPLSVDGADIVFPAAWETESDQLWPGSVLRLRKLTYWHRSRGKETLREGWEGLETLLETPSGLFPQTVGQTEVAIPASADRDGTIPYQLALRLKNGCLGTFVSNSGLTPTFTLHAGTPATPEADGAVPYSWLGHQAARMHRPVPVSPADYEAFSGEDTDGDGYSNGAEFIFGTDPADAGSRFGFTVFRPRQGLLPELGFPRIPGRRYQLQSAPAITGPWSPANAAHTLFRVRTELE